ncbi:MAG: hypothetical protein OXI73_15755 [Rhodospirillales bacterium]|nr:hypothetical protein [Rhodospirillales bacterium]
MSLSPTVELILALLAQREESDQPQKPVCSHCRSSEVMFATSAYWDTGNQRFVNHIVKCDVFCSECEEKHRPDWVPA